MFLIIAEIGLCGDYWNQPEPIWIDVKEQSTAIDSANNFNTISYVAIGIVLVVLISVSLLLIKYKRKKQ